MLRSMTGFGRGEAAQGAFVAVAEVRSVNHRYLVVKCRLPGRDLALEPALEKEVRRRARRGAFEVRVRVRSRRPLAEPRIDADLARSWLRAIGDLARSARVPSEVGVRDLLDLPGVVQLDEPDEAPPAEARAVLKAVRGALADLQAAREAEGERIRRALGRDLDRVGVLLRRIAQRARGAPGRQLERLRGRIERLLEGRGAGGEAGALEREAALLADRLDVQEEIDRLGSHIEGFAGLLDQAGPVGRALDFLSQEMAREANTIGAKTQDARQARLVIELKTAIERLREQVQNLE